MLILDAAALHTGSQLTGMLRRKEIFPVDLCFETGVDFSACVRSVVHGGVVMVVRGQGDLDRRKGRLSSFA